MSQVSRDLFLMRVNDKQAFIGAVVNGLKVAAPLLKKAGTSALNFAKNNKGKVLGAAADLGGKAMNFAKKNTGKAVGGLAAAAGTAYVGALAKKAGEAHGAKMFSQQNTQQNPQQNPQQGLDGKQAAFGDSYPLLNLLYSNTKHASAVGEIVARVAMGKKRR